MRRDSTDLGRCKSRLRSQRKFIMNDVCARCHKRANGMKNIGPGATVKGVGAPDLEAASGAMPRAVPDRRDTAIRPAIWTR